MALKSSLVWEVTTLPLSVHLKAGSGVPPRLPRRPAAPWPEPAMPAMVAADNTRVSVARERTWAFMGCSLGQAEWYWALLGGAFDDGQVFDPDGDGFNGGDGEVG